METSTHHLAGLAAGLAVAAHLRPGALSAVLVLGAATATAGGALSPDIDQRWRLLDRLIPDEWLGHGGPMRHRGLSHWWGIPAVAAVWLWLVRSTLLAPLWWLAAGCVLGWATHLAGDFLVGAQSEFRRAGIPLLPWWAHRGLGCRCGGLLEDTCRFIAFPALIVWQAAVLAGWAA
jgi:membrane-bound metal-dependent hydrolase YbcI (DUF457 family)